VSKVAAVTGAASGIGLGVARQLVADGHRVALLDRDGAGAEAAAADLRAGGGTAAAVEVDVADRAAVDAAFAKVRAELGPVELLVTSAGIESFQALGDITAESWDRIIAVNLTGTFACVQAAVPDMLAAGGGRIVTIASSSAQSGAPHMAHYAASKGGVISLTKSLAVEWAPLGIRVNALCPGWTATELNRNLWEDETAGKATIATVPMQRWGRAAEMAGPAVFLASDASSYMTGQALVVDGGQTTMA